MSTDSTARLLQAIPDAATRWPEWFHTGACPVCKTAKHLWFKGAWQCGLCQGTFDDKYLIPCHPEYCGPDLTRDDQLYNLLAVLDVLAGQPVDVRVNGNYPDTPFYVAIPEWAPGPPPSWGYGPTRTIAAFRAAWAAAGIEEACPI